MISAAALPIGHEAVLIEVDDTASVVALHTALREQIEDGGAPWDEILDTVPAAHTVLLIAPNCLDLAALGRAAVELAAGCQDLADLSETSEEAREVEIEVTYDGQDLDEIAEHTGLTREQIIEAHTGSTWTVAFFGFAPGFAYLTGGDPRLRVPRRDDPRTTVPQGSVALAGDFSAIYPRSSPGGWQLLGHTDEPMWDVDAEQPSRLHTGDRVRFVEATS